MKTFGTLLLKLAAGTPWGSKEWESEPGALDSPQLHAKGKALGPEATLFACSKSSLPTNIPSIRSNICTEGSGFICSKKCCSSINTRFRHCRTSCSAVGSSGSSEDPKGHLQAQERTKCFLQLSPQSPPGHSHLWQPGDAGRFTDTTLGGFHALQPQWG